MPKIKWKQNARGVPYPIFKFDDGRELVGDVLIDEEKKTILLNGKPFKYLLQEDNPYEFVPSIPGKEMGVLTLHILLDATYIPWLDDEEEACHD